MNKGDRFEVIRFSTEAEALFNGVVAASPENRRQAIKFVENLKAVGGTNIEDALNLALQQKGDLARSRAVLFITDGKPTINQTDENKLVDLVKTRAEGNVRIFTFGIGDEINTHLLDKITAQTHAYRSYIAAKEDIEVKISSLYTKIQSPVLTGLQLRTDASIRLSQVYPQDLPDLFKGASIMVLGRYEGSGKRTFFLEGRVNGKTLQYEYTLDFSDQAGKNEFIAPLWAARKVGWLLDQIRLNGENKELVDEVVELSRKYGIITPYTSYLIVEDEARQVTTRGLRPNELSFSPPAPVARDAMKRSFLDMKSKEGSGSVAASKSVQSLNDARNLEQNIQSETVAGEKGPMSTQQIRNILGRAMYQNGNMWIDPAVQKKSYRKNVQIKYGSEDYFILLQEKPVIARFLALGQNVKFVFDDTLYEVNEGP